MSNARLLVMDYQNFVVPMCKGEGALEPLGRAITGARESGMGILHVHVGFRPGYPEISARNPMMSGLAQSEALQAPEAWLPHPPATPLEGEHVVVKRRVSAFGGSDLDMLLRAQEVTDLVLTGVATSGVVLATLMEACDRDYVVTVLADACADPDPEVHRMLTEKVYPRRATVCDAATWVASL